MGSDRQLEELLEVFSTSRLQARQLEVLPALWLEELQVQVLPMLLPTESVTSSVEAATSSAEVARVEKEEREGRGARGRGREGRVVRAFLEGKAKAGAWMSLSLKSASLADFLEPSAEALLVGL